MTEPNAELPEEDPLVSVKLCGPEGCFLNKSKGTVVIANRAKETRDKQGTSGASPWGSTGTGCPRAAAARNNSGHTPRSLGDAPVSESFRKVKVIKDKGRLWNCSRPREATDVTIKR